MRPVPGDRGTVRHALELLEREGLVYREKGRGTFVRRRVQLEDQRPVFDHRGPAGTPLGARNALLGITSMIPYSHVQRQLHISAQEQVWEVYRLRLANGEAISLQWSYLPCERLPELDRQDLAGSLYYILKNVYGIELRTA